MRVWFLSFMYTIVLFSYAKELFVSNTKVCFRAIWCKCMPKNIPEQRLKIWKIISNIIWDSINEGY